MTKPTAMPMTTSASETADEHGSNTGGPPQSPKRALLVRFLCNLYRDWEAQQERLARDGGE